MTMTLTTDVLAVAATDRRWFSIQADSGETLSWRDDGGKLFELESGWAVVTGEPRGCGALVSCLPSTDLSGSLRAVHGHLAELFDALVAAKPDWAETRPTAELRIVTVAGGTPRTLATRHTTDGHRILALDSPSVRFPPYGPDMGAERGDELWQRFGREVGDDPSLTGLSRAVGRLFHDAAEGTEGMSRDIDVGYLMNTDPPWTRKWGGPARQLAENPMGALGAVAS